MNLIRSALLVLCIPPLCADTVAPPPPTMTPPALPPALPPSIPPPPPALFPLPGSLTPLFEEPTPSYFGEWQIHHSGHPTPYPLDSGMIAHGAGDWLFVSRSGKLLHSDDGTQWTPANGSGDFADFFPTTLAFGDGRWIGTRGGHLLHSEDGGANWAEVALPADARDLRITQCAYSGGRYLAWSNEEFPVDR